MVECASRECWIVAPGEDEPSPLRIAFHSPEREDEFIYVGLLSMTCAHFEKNMPIHGVDSMQALLLMPFMAHAYLCHQRRRGYQLYWCEPGDFDASFWGNSPAGAENPRTAGPLLRLARRLKLAPPP
jgi:hypothetical protein